MRAFKIISISLGVIVLLLYGAGYYFLSGICANTVITSSVSPSGKWKAILFERNCGATTGFSSQISLLKSDSELNNEAGNIYIAKGYPKGYNINWKSDDSVTISGTSADSIKKIARFNDIQITYK